MRTTLHPWRLLCAALLLLAAHAHGQNGPQLKHRLFVYWGYNRAQYSRSDIRLTGNGYDFTLAEVAAKDRPEPFSLGGYFNPKTIWIPQYNYRAGWFLNDRWSLSLGLDHMKYVVANGQNVAIHGTISRERSEAHALADGSSEVRLTPDFLAYEHTDGLNLLSVDADRYHLLWAGRSGKQALYFTEGAFAGAVIPRTEVHLFGEGLNNQFHLAGYGVGAQAGLFAVAADRLFLRAQVRGGFINLPSVLTTGKTGERARQHFWFLEENVVLGVLIGRTAG
ncbi:MAG: hypothetical protein KBH07_07845 [Flavobacteriales bacterium]|nr:hypothetical protein [Flavobacteriales bacterium]